MAKTKTEFGGKIHANIRLTLVHCTGGKLFNWRQLEGNRSAPNNLFSDELTKKYI